MKKIINLILAIILVHAVNAQTPTGFNYQAVLRSSQGQVLVNQAASLRISLTSSNGLTTHYQEIHTVTSTAQGLVNIVIGKGSEAVGSIVDVPWDSDQIALKLEIKLNDATAYTNMGSQPLQAVPYALYASNTKEIESSTAATDDEPIFVVRNKLGQIVFAVYQGGVRVYVEDNAKATKSTKGGFAIGGLSGTKEATEYMRITPDSARIYINEPTVKGTKGGFAIGGLSGTKSTTEYLSVTPDSTRIYIDDSGKGTKGGFAIRGLSGTKGMANNFFDVATDITSVINPSKNKVLWYPLKNAFLAGRVLIEDADSVGENSFSTGYESKAIGLYSQAMGHKTNAKGDYSTAMGNNSIAKNTNAVAIGLNAEASGYASFSFGESTKASGTESFALGCYSKAEGDWAIAMGYNATAGYKSFAVGHNATSTGLKSVALGSSNLASGETSIAIGHGAYSTGNSSVAIGRNANASANHSMALGISSDGGTEVTSANAVCSYAIGKFAVTNGDFSTAIGYRVKSNTYHGFAIGRWNLGEGSPSTWNGSDPIFEIGNGSSATSKSNALTVYKNGDARISGNVSINKGVEISGTLSLPITNTSINITLGESNYTVLVDASDVNVYLPSATTCKGRIYVIKYTNSSTGNVYIRATSSETIDGSQIKTITNPWDRLTIQSNGLNWFLIN